MNSILTCFALTRFALTRSAFSALPCVQNRFPKPDFESGYAYPGLVYGVPDEILWTCIDLAALVLFMSVTAWATLRKRLRTPVLAVAVSSVAYFGFFRKGCVCSIGAIQNVSLALVDSSYAIPLSVLAVFILPLVFALLFGRVFCAGTCPFGALQELINIRNHKVPRPLASFLSLVPWIYLLLALVFAMTRSSFVICRFDPFIGIFRMGGEVPMIVAGAVLLIASIFTGRPFCRFLCPYGALLGLFSRVSVWNVKIVKQSCINCDLCRNACYVDAIRPPCDNKVKESRPAGVRRILLYLVVLPFMAFAGALAGRALSDSFAGTDKKVRLLEMVLAADAEKNSPESQSFELEAFHGRGGDVGELSTQVVAVRNKFKRYSTGAGAMAGIIVGISLTGLSVKRARKHYEINDAHCVSCGRCFAYCPQNLAAKSD
ncbi:MAG: 4Fe-4S binding protein [Prevotellaceae bacterium]|jgi:ferredoxin|nr:4Fe-4S binding protein [Prevotellaceae bacterium]